MRMTITVKYQHWPSRQPLRWPSDGPLRQPSRQPFRQPSDGPLHRDDPLLAIDIGPFAIKKYFPVALIIILQFSIDNVIQADPLIIIIIKLMLLYLKQLHMK